MKLYREIAQKFNDRYSSDDFDYITEFLNKIFLDDERILDLACGTFHWGSVVKGNVFGVDISFEMLTSSKKRAKLINAKAEFLPFAEKTFDKVFIVNAFHQFEDKVTAASEISRVLKNNGIIYIISVDFFNPEFSWYIYEYFPNTYEIDKKRFFSKNKLIDIFGNLSFDEINFKRINTTRKIYINEEVFTDKFLKKHNTSQLAALSEDEYLKGIDKIKKEIAKRGETEFIVNIPSFVFMAEKK